MYFAALNFVFNRYPSDRKLTRRLQAVLPTNTERNSQVERAQFENSYYFLILLGILMSRLTQKRVTSNTTIKRQYFDILFGWFNLNLIAYCQ